MGSLTTPAELPSQIISAVLAESFRGWQSAFSRTDRSQPHKIYLFGHPISHSIAPEFHNVLYRRCNLPWQYELLDSLDPRDLAAAMQSATTIGISVTMPHKLSAMRTVSALTTSARMIGAINTIIVRSDGSGQRRFVGANTDHYGIFRALVEGYPSVLDASITAPAVIIGAGGACRSAIYALWKCFGVEDFLIINRNEDEVQCLTKALIATGVTAKVSYLREPAQLDRLEKVFCLLGTVPDQEPSQEGEHQVRMLIEKVLSGIPPTCVLDMCYYPRPETWLLRTADRHGWSTINGVGVLIHQAVLQAVLWMEGSITESDMIEAAKQTRSYLARRNDA